MLFIIFLIILYVISFFATGTLVARECRKNMGEMDSIDRFLTTCLSLTGPIGLSLVILVLYIFPPIFSLFSKLGRLW